jgi:hypothetical protein
MEVLSRRLVSIETRFWERSIASSPAKNGMPSPVRTFYGANVIDIYNSGRVAQPFDPAGITNTVGAPLFAFFAKGGYYERLHLRS